ncbi:MAG: TonB-dependent receptor plug domain-containing protein [Roseivirga sp.]|nr:TonB-dependent receptor plug domain-containing protein [Roseivirga sp.]
MKKTYLSLGLLTLLILASAFQSTDPSPFLKKLRQQLASYNADFKEEKVYLQTDKPFYKPGETIWFNAFVLNSTDHKPTATSDVLYVELIDPKGNVAAKADLVIREGTAHAEFQLDENDPGGLYQIRAYTQWMKNFDEQAFFKKTITVQRVITPRLLLNLDFEKEAYGPGDEVTAKLKVENLKNETMDASRTAYTVSIDGSQILSSVVKTDSKGVATIQFTLPGDLSSTNGLLNVIVSADGYEESISRSVPIVLDKINLTFFPEGGHQVKDVSGKMAFKALNEFGKGADISGSILDQDNNKVTSFESFHMGMGAFAFKPESDQQYFARIESPRGNETLIPLPKALNTGLSLNLDSREAHGLSWKIHSPFDGEVILVGNAHGEMIYAEKITVKKGLNTVTVPTDNFAAGIGVFTLFNYQGIEQCERLVFLNQDRGLNIELTTDKDKYQPREKVDLKVKTTDHQGKPVRAKLSLAVVDDQLISFADDKQDNILSALLLGSELKGEVQEPSFYFDPEEPKATEALDYLLLTQGWRRFTWKEVQKPTRKITYLPEKNKDVFGRVYHQKNGAGFATEVSLIELGGKKRIETVQTTKNGEFIFKNTDPTVSFLLVTKKPGKITRQKEQSFSISLNDRAGTVWVPEKTDLSKTRKKVTQLKPESPVDKNASVNISLSADATSLGEVVVTGYGVVEKKAITGSVVVVERTPALLPKQALSNVLEGRIPGLMVQRNNGNPGSANNIVIRGVNTLANNNHPLYIIDGYPISSSLNNAFSNGSMISPLDIESIEVMSSPEAAALYGNAGANGVIVITTKSRLGYRPYYGSDGRKQGKYTSIRINPRQFTVSREFYIPPPTDGITEIRNDFRTTVHWAHTLVTDKKGESKVSFYNNDAVSAFRITAEGFSSGGSIGRKEQVYYTQLPLSLDVKFPQFLGFEDVLRLPVQLRNETNKNVTGKLKLKLDEGMTSEGELLQNVSLPPNKATTVYYTIRSEGKQGKFPVQLTLESRDYTDEIRHTFEVRPVGFPVQYSFSAKALDQTVSLTMSDVEQNSATAVLTTYPNMISDLFSGAESILRQPYGCFEQVSSSTFPNILALQFMRESESIDKGLQRKAMSYIKNGYRRLTAYEIEGGGFEWFGRPAAHEGLSAFGLIQFHEMKKVFPGVSEDMMNRTRDWLMKKRDGKGGFEQHKGKYGFSAAKAEVTNAYITYALSETGTRNLEKEYQTAYKEATESRDMYRMALVAHTAFNLDKMEEYKTLIQVFREQITNPDFKVLQADHSLVRSYGKSLQTEITALWTVALLKDQQPDLSLIQLCIDRIVSSRRYGGFGSTQATSLALKALTEYAHLIKAKEEDGAIELLVDNSHIESLTYKAGNREKLSTSNFADLLNHNGKQQLKVRFKDTKEALPYSVDIQWYTKTPSSSKECKVRIATSLSASRVKVNETVRLTATLSNTTAGGVPMTMGIIGIPAGLSLQPWQLKEMQEKGVFDFYEITDGNLVVYYREMGPEAQHVINLDLKADIPGEYLGTASSAYLYYTDEFKHYTKGEKIVVD